MIELIPSLLKILLRWLMTHLQVVRPGGSATDRQQHFVRQITEKVLHICANKTMHERATQEHICN